MNKAQRIVLYLFAVVVIAMGLIPPYHYRNRFGIETNCGHDFVWNPPHIDGNIYAVIDVASLAEHVALAALVAGTLYLALRSRDSR